MLTNKPHKIYDYILKHIEDIESKLNQSLNDKGIDNAKQKAYELISDFKNQELNKRIKELKNSEEWDTFTIAFYGETNAGKSTILEALRIFFNEETKVKTQNIFKKYYHKYINEKKLIKKELSERKLKIENYNNKYKLLSNYENNEIEIKKQIEDLENKHIKKIK